MIIFNIGFWILIMLLIILNYLAIISTLNKNKRKIIQKYKLHFDYFDLDKLKVNFKFISNKYALKGYKKLDVISEKINYLDRQIQDVLLEDYHELFKNVSNWRIFSSRFSSALKKIKNSQFEYEIFYLDILFDINELNLNYEIKDRILINLKNLFSEIKQLIDHSQYAKKILNSKIQHKLLNFEKEIIKLESLLEDENNLKDFKLRGNSLSKLLKSTIDDIKFYNDNYFYLEITIPEFDRNLKMCLNENINGFFSLLTKWKREIKEIKGLIEILKVKIDELDDQATENLKEKINEKIIEILYEAKSNIRTYNFLVLYEQQFININNQLKNQYSLLEKEIEVYLSPLKEQELTKITAIYKKVMQHYLLYRDLLKEGFALNSPILTFEAVKRLLLSYREFLEIAEEEIQKINGMIEKSNIINRSLSKMNTILLRSEARLNDLPDELKLQKESEIQKYETRISELIDKHYNKYVIYDINEKDNLDDFILEISKFSEETKSYAYLYKYLEWVILILNKYHSDETEINNLIKNVQDSYLRGELSEALRVANKIIEIYNIYE